MTATEALVPGAIAILFVVSWFAAGLLDAFRHDKRAQSGQRSAHPVRESAHRKDASRSR
ncbi:hypothetical protein [Terrabacter sp. NPDC080008]|uniref:hypothetical protein n=1 Tax=Terrabacter sp. NPDC080008 TaxID=3155176 RepID=UPI00344F2970